MSVSPQNSEDEYEVEEGGIPGASEAFDIADELDDPTDENEDEDGFVTDDEDGITSAAVNLEMPLEFTRHYRKKPIEYFRDAVEWMIQNKLNPAFARHDPLYQVAFMKLDDEYKAYAGSKFISAAWTVNFIKALKESPDVSHQNVSAVSLHHCEACNRTGHPAKWVITFGGKRYDRETLEDLDSESSEKDGSNSEEGSSHEPERSFYVGR